MMALKTPPLWKVLISCITVLWLWLLTVSVSRADCGQGHDSVFCPCLRPHVSGQGLLGSRRRFSGRTSLPRVVHVLPSLGSGMNIMDGNSKHFHVKNGGPFD